LLILRILKDAYQPILDAPYCSTSPPGVVGKAVLDEGMAAVTADGSGVFDPLAALRAGFAGGRARKH